MAFVTNTQNAGTSRSALVNTLLSSLQSSLGKSGNTVEGLFSGVLSDSQAAGATGNQTPVNNKSPNQQNDKDNGNDSASVQAKVSANVKTQSNWKPQARTGHHANAQSSKAQPKSADRTQPDNDTKTASAAHPADNSKPAPATVDDSDGDTDSCAVSTTTTNSDGSDTLPADTSASAEAAAATFAQQTDAQAVMAAVTTDVTATTDTDTADQNQDPKDKDAVSDELLSLLLQLERIAAAQAQAGAAVTASVQATASQPTDATKAADPNNKDPALDLKALMDAIARLKQGNTNDGDADDSDASQTTSTAFSADVTASAASSAAPAQQQPTDKPAASALINLLNVVPTNQPAAPQPAAAFNAAILANATAGNGQSDQTSSDLLNQNGSGSRNMAGAMTADAGTMPLTGNNTQAANPYDFASQLSAMRATRGGPTGLPTPVEQVMLQLSRAVSKDGVSQMTIQLKPAELGRVDVKLSISSDGKVQGTVTADNSSTLGLLLKDVRGLERALQEAGLRADPGSLQFNLRGDGQQPGGGFGQPTGGNSNNNGGGFETDASLSVFNDATETYYLTPGGVNMRV